MNPDIERGSMYQFQDGYPEVRMTAIGLLDEDDNSYISVNTEIVYGSLIYRTIDDVTFAQVTVEIRINQIDGNFSKSAREQLDIISDDPGDYMNQEVFSYDRDLDVDPGNYEIEVSVTDNSSGRTVVRTTDTLIPDPQNPVTNLTSIRLAGKTVAAGPEFNPITTYDVPSRIDSLKLQFQVTNNDIEDPLTVEASLLKYRADTTAARRLSYNNYSTSSIQYQGIDVRNPEEIDNNVRVLEQAGSVLIEFKYALLPRGNYRFEVETTNQTGETIYRARDFAVKAENYPSVASSREMAEPLIYLMDERRHREMMEIQDPDSLKEAVDRFWLSNVGSQSRARSVISLYYERVEQANKQFSNFKEGWKTDMGMIFILFGPPWYVDRSLNRMQWSYSYDRRDPRRNFFFERNRNPNEYFPFNHYIAERSQNYFNVIYQQTELWRTGRILEANL
ncbi:GWxTD domain-containing protein [Rhodohalobacter sp. SW132]|uniref:GWxTD domain-containing protein n=1 Tax=Rhodohalobacter sp. SW132 TaxID=2293433 RepID=UPI0013152417|nr:GWxTD domain-containing protein [Rhodohalobacter sp. SW132]